MRNQKAIDDAIARQLSRSMAKNARLTARIHALRSIIDTVLTSIPDGPLHDLCKKALEIDDGLSKAE
jgi:hypothetical protein